MKSAKQWVDEYSQSGAFDLVEDCNEAELIVQQIQQDAVNVISLCWKKLNDGWIAETPFGNYEIAQAPESSRWKKPYIWSFEGSFREAQTVMHCMRNAASDFERKVMACLTDCNTVG
jgi:hypothetical protein